MAIQKPTFNNATSQSCSILRLIEVHTFQVPPSKSCQDTFMNPFDFQRVKKQQLESGKGKGHWYQRKRSAVNGCS